MSKSKKTKSKNAAKKDTGSKASTDKPKLNSGLHVPKSTDKKKTKKSAARATAEAIAIVLFLVVFIRGWILESFKIPTSSMEPELIGNPYYGDRVIAWKPSVNWQTPERWSIYVFLKRPDEQEIAGGVTTSRNFIKRMVGMPNESLLITTGNIFTRTSDQPKYAIAQKPLSVQTSLWHTVYDSQHDADFSTKPRWELTPGLEYNIPLGQLKLNTQKRAWAQFSSNHYEGDNGLITNLYLRDTLLDVSCPICEYKFKANFNTGRTRARCPNTECSGRVDILTSGISDNAPAYLECNRCKRAIVRSKTELSGSKCPHCKEGISKRTINKTFTAPGRYPIEQKLEQPVTDIAIECNYTPQKQTGLVLLEINTHPYTFLAEINIATNSVTLKRKKLVENKLTELNKNTASINPLAPNKPHALHFSHCDQKLLLIIDGFSVAKMDCPVSWRELAITDHTNKIRFGGENTTGVFSGIKFLRDIHHTARAHSSQYEFYYKQTRRWSKKPRDSNFSNTGSADAIRTREPIQNAHYLMLGDNSPSSYDGRMWPAVAENDLMGKAVILFWPPSNLKLLD